MTFKPIAVASFGTSAEAHLARTKLEAEGIPCYLTDENIVNANWLYAQAVGGIRLMTDESRAEEAAKVLRGMNIGAAEPEHVCSRCGTRMHATLASSLLNALVLIVSLGLSIILFKKSLIRYRCGNCGYFV